MKKTNVPKGIPLFRLGIALSILALSSCMEIADDSDLVTVRVNIPKEVKETAEETRSLNLAIAKAKLNFYEIVFMDTTTKACYSGTTDGYNTLTVALPPGTYSILLLGGNLYKGVYVLLATGYIASKPITAAGPNTIEFNTAQTQLKAIAFDPGIKNNIIISYSTNGGGAYTDVIVDRKAMITDNGKVPTFSILKSSDGSWDNIATNNVYRITAKLTFEHLNTARTAAGTSSAALFADQKLTLWAAYTGFTSVKTTGTQSSGFVASDPAINAKVATLEFKVNNSVMPDADAYGLLYFDLFYYAFSHDAKTTTKWRIRPGLDFHQDAQDITNNKTNRGGSVLVKIGNAGSPPGTDEEVHLELGDIVITGL